MLVEESGHQRGGSILAPGVDGRSVAVKPLDHLQLPLVGRLHQRGPAVLALGIDGRALLQQPLGHLQVPAADSHIQRVAAPPGFGSKAF